MSKKYNIKSWNYGDWELPAKRNLTPKQYAEEIYKLNQRTAEEYYKARRKEKEKLGKKHLEDFEKKFADAKSLFFKEAKTKQIDVIDKNGHKVPKNTYYTSKKEWKKLIETKLGKQVQRFKDSFIIGLQEEFRDEYDKFMNIINNEYDAAKLKYVGDGLYEYRHTDSIILLNISESPQKFTMTVEAIGNARS